MALAVHAVIAVALIAAYVTVTVTGHDGAGLLGALVGYLGGVATQVGLRKTGAAPPP